MAAQTDRHVHDAVIIGAGFGGMGAAIALRRLDIDDIVILDREDDLGGTWHVNRYPGLAVDIPSATYSYSFEPNPYWSRLYARGGELKNYCDHVATKYDLRRHMRFGVVVDGARWDDEERHWIVNLHDGETLTARYLLTATGFLSQPKMPDIPGIETFDGTVVHTTKWDDDLDLEGRQAAVIGTGATAVQLIPEIAPKLSELTVFQRTAIWVTPKSDGPVPKRVQSLYARLPFTQRVARGIGSGVLEALMVAGVLKYRRFKSFNRIAEKVAKRHMARQVRDPETRRKLTPDYSFGCKRPTFSNNYFPTFNLPHVHLETTPIARIEPDAIVTEDGTRHEIDTLVLATGFNLWDTNFPAIEVIGREGRNLGKWWRENRFQAYEGIAVPMFPNLLQPQQPVLVLRTLLLHDHREPDEAHDATAQGDASSGRHRLRGDGGGERRVPRPDDGQAGRLGLHARLLLDRAQLLLQPARRGDAAASDLDDRRVPRGRALPDLRLRPVLSAPSSVEHDDSMVSADVREHLAEGPRT